MHGDCIEDFFLCFSKLKSAFPFLEIHLYGQRQPTDFLSEFLSIDGVTHHGILMPLEKKFEIMRSAHCFMIPSSFSLNNHAHYRFSFPTKLPELLCTGRPILSYGPAETATNRILADLELGVQVNHRSQVDLANAIKEIILNYPKYLYSSQTRVSLKNQTLHSQENEIQTVQGFKDRLSMFLKSLLSVNAVQLQSDPHTQKHFYQDLGISIPVNANLWADLVANDSFDSFSEIFIKQEYEDYLPNETPLSVVDIGKLRIFQSLASVQTPGKEDPVF